MVAWDLPSSRKHPFWDNNSVSDLETACLHHAVMVSQEHCCGRTFYRLDALPVTQPTASRHWRPVTIATATVAITLPRQQHIATSPWQLQLKHLCATFCPLQKLQGLHKLCWSSKMSIKILCGLLHQDFFEPDAFSIAQPTPSKYWKGHS